MQQVVDSAGNKLVGIFKKNDGSIVVINPNEFKKVVGENNVLLEISELKERITQLEKLIQDFIAVK